MIAGGQQYFRSPWLRCVSHWRDLAQEFPRFEGLDGAEPMPTPSCVAGYLTLLDMLRYRLHQVHGRRRYA